MVEANLCVSALRILLLIHDGKHFSVVARIGEINLKSWKTAEYYGHNCDYLSSEFRF